MRLSLPCLACLVLTACDAAPETPSPAANGQATVRYGTSDSPADAPFEVAFAIHGSVFEFSGSASGNSFGIWVVGPAGPLSFEAVWSDVVLPSGLEPFFRAEVTQATYAPTPDDTIAPPGLYGLGPDGGEVQVSEMTTNMAGAIHVEGSFRAQLCEVYRDSPCLIVVSQFTFDVQDGQSLRPLP